MQQQVHINLLGLRDPLSNLASQDWSESLTQPQSAWLAHPRHEMSIRNDRLLQQIEQACLVPVKPNGSSVTKVQRLGDLTESTQGIIPYVTHEAGEANSYIKPLTQIPATEADWKPLLDGDSFVGRYELRWSSKRPYLKYGGWLGRPREAKFFESPKLLVQDMRNRALKRRLVATFDDQKFYNRHNFSNIIIKDPACNLKYILAVFNSRLLNYWFARQYDNLHINPSYFRQIPVYPADAAMQEILISLVDKMLANHAELNEFRAQGYIIRAQSKYIRVPYEVLLRQLRTARLDFPVLTLYDARAIGLFSIPANCDLSVAVSKNIFTPAKYPNTIVLRHNKLWFEVPDERWRGYLLNYLQSPHWQRKTWDDLKDTAFLPEDENALQELFTLEQQKRERILALLNEIQQIDAEIDNRVLDLYGITDPVDRQRVLGSAPLEEEEPTAEAVMEAGDVE